MNMKQMTITVNGKDYEVVQFAGESRVYVRRASGTRAIIKSAATHDAVVAAARAAGF